MRRLNAAGTRRDFVVVGASAGGVFALQTLFRELPPHPAFTLTVVLHRSPYSETGLPAVLGLGTRLHLSEPRNDERIASGHVYVAPRDQHLVVYDGVFRRNRGPREHFTRPAIDPLFYSAARHYGARVVGVLLTGGGEDGTDGLNAIKAAGGISIVQEPAEAPHPWMPLTALTRDHVDLVLPLAEMAPTLLALAEGRSVEVARFG